MTDITAPVETFLSGFLGFITSCYNLLDSISLFGISLLDFFITVLVISIVLPLILTLLKSRSVSSRKERGVKK